MEVRGELRGEKAVSSQNPAYIHFPLHVRQNRVSFSAFCGMFTKITFIPMHARQNHLYSHLLPSQMSYYGGFGRSITIKNLPLLESPFHVRNIATSKWLATSTARMKMANMRANQDLGNTRDFGEHATKGGNKRGRRNPGSLRRVMSRS